MSQTGTILQHSRTDIRIAGAQQGSANVLFIYAGEVGCNFVSDSANTLHDTLYFEIPDAEIAPAGNKPVPIVLPTSWNVKDTLNVVSVESPSLGLISGKMQGLTVTAGIAVQNGMLLRVQYQVSVIAFVS